MTLFLLPALGLLATGCLSRPSLVRQNFALQPAPPANKSTPKGPAVLAVRALQVSPLFDGRSFVYRTGPDLYEEDPYAGFLVAPNRALAIPLRNYLRSAGPFKDVVESGSQLGADQFLEVHASELYGDFRQPGQLAAVLSMRVLLFEGGNDKPQKLVLEKEYSRRTPVAQKSAAALVDGWNKGFSEILAEVNSDLTAAQAGRQAPITSIP